MSETERLQRLWAGEFGDAYSDRNAEAHAGRDRFWRTLLSDIDLASVLEVGCNVGGNFRWLVELLPEARLAAVDVNEAALVRVRGSFPSVDAVRAAATSLPFDDNTFDLVFTTGVLIHLPDEALGEAMTEIVRCSSRYVLCGEYHADEDVEIPYRGVSGALFKRDYGRLYTARFPQLRLLAQGLLPRELGGWDDLAWWLFDQA